jgi:type IV secretion system protein VirD4
VLAAEPRQSVAIIGPTQSGKTSSLAVPAILGWDGPVLAASVKTDLVRDTLAWRRSVGRVWCFDPAGTTGLPADRWSPLRTARTWSGARRLAADLTEVARREGTTADGEFWYTTAAKLLAPLLLAAAHGGHTMADVVRWVDTQETEEVLNQLEDCGVEEALQAMRASWLRDDRQRGSVYTTVETVLEPFAGTVDLGPLAEHDASGIDAAALLDGTNTLYLCAPAHDQRRLQGLFVALVKHVLEETFARSSRAGAPLQPPLLVVLDEAANIAPLAELDSLAATCAGHGVQLVTVWQDLAQVSARYGARAATVINNHRAKVFLSGISDPGTLDHASRLVGDEEVLVPSVTRDAGGRRSTTLGPVRRPLLPADALRRSPPGTGVLVYGALPPVRVSLVPWWDDPELARRVGGGPGRPLSAAGCHRLERYAEAVTLRRQRVARFRGHP